MKITPRTDPLVDALRRLAVGCALALPALACAAGPGGTFQPTHHAAVKDAARAIG
ncbi:hypothetical protein PO002_23910 [Cupriavidus necator]|uniref:hypothetical protein n=1 Tax=Cupriavidus necator TaxID=106590 RepID=UPI0039C2AE61